jgi:methyl-accepting chemotaxis protein/methyl-accepting chemotaxis protein-1 (serine sensor receptor)
MIAAEGARLWTWILLLICVTTGVLLSWFVVKSINQVLNAAVSELGQGADQVASAATEIAASSQSLAQGTSEQAASLEETSASSEEMASMTRKNADNSIQCAQLMLQVDSRVIAANQTLGEMVNSMNEINSSSDKISKIIKVIDEIAFQTNILALNAAVEAARAGQAGLGFAVVADEVRTLAQRSAQAAKDTATLIEESISCSNEGSAKLTQVSDAISTITHSTNQVKTLVDEVNLGSQEQARGVEQIAKAIAQIERVTQQAASSSEETASASEELTAQVGAIRTIVGRLESLVDHAHPTTGKSSPTSSSTKNRAKKPVSMARSLNALKSATSPKASPRKTEFVPQHSYAAAGKPERNAIPMDDDFKEF